MTNPDGPVAGWYPDPYDGAQLRYFDGQNWTESVAPAGGGSTAPAPAADPYGQPQYGQPQYGQPYATNREGGGLGEFGEWFGASLSAVFSRIVPLTLLLFVVPAVGVVAAALLALATFGDVVYERGSDRFTGFDAGPLILAAVILAVVGLIGFVTWLAAHHQMYSTHLGRPATVGRSLSVGLVRLPRAIGWGLVLLLGAIVVYVGLIVLVVAAVVGLGEGVGILVAVVAGLGAMVAVFWIGVRLVFWPVAVAVDTRTNPFTASWNATRNRFWAVFGRVLAVGIAAYIVSFVFQFASNGLVALAVPGYVETSPDGDVLINGIDVADADVLRIGDLLPSTGLILVTLLLYVLGQAASQALTVSAVTGLYARADGPAEV